MALKTKGAITYTYRQDEEEMHILVAPIGESDYTKRTRKINDTEFNPPPVRFIEQLEAGKAYYLVGEISPYANESPVVFLFHGMEGETTIPVMNFTAFTDHKNGTEPFSFPQKVWVGDRDNIGIFPPEGALASDHYTHALLPLKATSPKEAIAEAKEIARKMKIQLH